MLSSCRTVKDATTWYLVKWRDLAYDQATWETEDEGVIDLVQYIEDYHNLRSIMLGVTDKKPKKIKTKKSRTKSRREKKKKKGSDDNEDDLDDEEDEDTTEEDKQRELMRTAKKPPEQPTVDVSPHSQLSSIEPILSFIPTIYH